jgi:hypothetical protein
MLQHVTSVECGSLHNAIWKFGLASGQIRAVKPTSHFNSTAIGEGVKCIPDRSTAVYFLIGAGAAEGDSGFAAADLIGGKGCTVTNSVLRTWSPFSR